MKNGNNYQHSSLKNRVQQQKEERYQLKMAKEQSALFKPKAFVQAKAKPASFTPEAFIPSFQGEKANVNDKPKTYSSTRYPSFKFRTPHQKLIGLLLFTSAIASFVSSVKGQSAIVSSDECDEILKTMESMSDMNSTLPIETMDVLGGGYGGNVKIGMVTYDGLPGNLPELAMRRDPKTETCYLENDEITIRDMRKNFETVSFPCPSKNAEHNDVYWDGMLSAKNGGYSPSNDVLYGMTVTNKLFKDWYGIPVVVNDKTKKLIGIINFNNHGQEIDNAVYGSFGPDETAAYFGNGKSIFYPVTCLDCVAHEFAHGFTAQHSGLMGDGVINPDAGGLNEAFSDMTGQAVMYHLTGKNNWMTGSDITKENGTALRYMDEPTKDCYGKKPGRGCSIDHVKDATKMGFQGRIPHFTAGVFNKAFYLLSTSELWNVKKAFDVMVRANMDYWTSDATFESAACGVVKATVDYKFDVDAVKQAMKKVGIDTDECQLDSIHKIDRVRSNPMNHTQRFFFSNPYLLHDAINKTEVDEFMSKLGVKPNK